MMNNGVEYLDIYALDKNITDDIKFLVYTLPSDDFDPCLVEEWIERSTFIEEDLVQLLKSSHKDFWSHILHNQSLHDCITSFLRSARRPHDKLASNADLSNAIVKTLDNRLQKYFFLTCLRMATAKEGVSACISKDQFSRLVYDESVYDIPRLLDFCAIYGRDNEALVSKMIGSLFLLQPKYRADLSVVIRTLFELFSAVEKKLGVEMEDAPRRLSDLLEKKGIDSLQEAGDLVFYVSDISHTLMAFVKCAPMTAAEFFNEGFLFRLVEFYDHFVENLFLILRRFDDASTKKKKVPTATLR